MQPLRDSRASAVLTVSDPQVALGPMLEGLPDAAVGARRDGLIAFVNTLAEEQFGGYPRGELIGRPLEVLWPPNVRARYRRNLELYWELEHPLRFSARAHGRRRGRHRLRRRDELGHRRRPTRDRVLLAIGRDISERLGRRGAAAPPVRAAGRGAPRSASVRCAGVGPQRAERGGRGAGRARRCAVDRVAVLDRAEGDRGLGRRRGVPPAASACRSTPATRSTARSWRPRRAKTPSARRRGSFLQAVANVLAIAFSRLPARGAHPPPGAPRPADRARQPRALPRPHRARARALRARRAAPPPCCSSTSTTSSASTTPSATRAGDRAADQRSAQRLAAAVRAGRHGRAARRGRVRRRAARTSTSARRSRSAERLAAAVQEPDSRPARRPTSRPASASRSAPAADDRPRRAHRPRRRGGLPGQGARRRRARSSTRGCAGARPTALQTETRPRGRARAGASSSSSSSRSCRSPTAPRSPHEALLRWRRLGGAAAIEPGGVHPGRPRSPG